MSLEITGKIHLIEDEQQISPTFKKRIFVLFVLNEYNEDYSDYIPFELKQDRTDLLNPYKVGEMIKVHFNLKGNKWTNKEGVDKYFSSNEAWRIEKVESTPVDAQPINSVEPTSNDENDLPF